MSEEGKLPPVYTKKLESEAAPDPADILATKLKEACKTEIAVAHSASTNGGTFFLTVPTGFSRKELTKIGFKDEDIDRIHREDTPNSWVVTGISDATSLCPAGIWPDSGNVVAKGFEKAMARQNKALSYCVVDKIAPGAHVPTPRGKDVEIIPVTADKTVLVLSGLLVKERLPDIFPQRQIS